MEVTFNDYINGTVCSVTVNAGKKSKIVSVKGIDVLPDKIQQIYERECSTHYKYYKEYSEHERSKFFRGKCITGDPREILKKLYEKWDAYYKNGTPDPNWCDGVGLNMIRSDILLYKNLILELCLEEEYPECFYYEIPSLVDGKYVAHKKGLIKTGYLYAEKLEQEPLFKEIKETADRTLEYYKKMCSADKWGALRNIHWMARLPEIYRSICESNSPLDLPKLKMFRKNYETLLKELKETLKKALEEEKEKERYIEVDTEKITESWYQMSLFDFLTV